MTKRIKSYIYTQGKFGKGFRETLDTENIFLYSHGRYPTKITAEDLPKDYIKIHSRVIWYMTGYLKTSGIVDIQYRWVGENHLFKDDYIYISYKEKLKKEISDYGFVRYTNYDVCVCGNDIVDTTLYAEKYSGLDISHIREGIKEKCQWLKKNEPDFYKAHVQNYEPELFRTLNQKL